MATEAVTRRIIELDVKTSSEALRALKAQQQMLGNLEKSITSAKDSLKQFGLGLVSAFSVGAVISGIKGAIDAMDALNDKSGQLGISASALQEWSHAATMSGASAEDMEKGIIGLSKSMNDMDKATSQSTKALKAFGVTATDNIDEALTKIAEGFSKMDDGPRKTALALDLFGKAGSKLIPMLNEGAAGIEKLKKEAHDLGLVISDETIAAAAKLNDDFDRLKKSASVLGMQIVEGLLPALQNIATTLLDSGKAGDGWVEVGRKLGDGLINLSALAIATGAAFEALGKIGSYMWWLITNPTTPYGPVFEKLESDLKKLEERTNERLGKMRDRYVATQNAATEFARANASAIDKLMGPQSGGGGGGGGGSEAEKQAEAWKKYTESLRMAALETKNMTEQQKLLLAVQQGKLVVTDKATAALKKEAEAAAKLADLRAFQVAQEKKDKADGEKRNEELKKEAENIDRLRESMLDAQDPVRQIVREMALLDLVISKTTDPETIQKLERYGSILERAFGKAAAGAKDMAVTFKTEFEDLGVSIGRQVQTWGADVTNAIVDMAQTGKLEVKEMVNSMLADLARLLVYRQVQPAFDALATWIGSIGKNPSAQGNVFGPRGIQAFASGGVVGGPTLFGMAGGGVGLMGEAGPEAVVPLKRTASGDLGVQASAVTVNVINNNGSQIKTEETRAANGDRQLQIMVDSAVAESIGRGRFDRVMSTAYGVTRRGR